MQDGEKHMMTFDWIKTKKGEDTLVGGGSDENGAFALEGEINAETRTVIFNKTYEESGQVVNYRAYINGKRTTMQGDWNIDDVCDQFKMKAVPDPENPKLKIDEDGKVWWQKKNEWTCIKEGVKILQWHLEDVFVLLDDDRTLWKWKYASPDDWDLIGEDIDKVLVTSGDNVLKKCKKHHNWWLWDGFGNNWTYHPMNVWQ